MDKKKWLFLTSILFLLGLITHAGFGQELYDYDYYYDADNPAKYIVVDYKDLNNNIAVKDSQKLSTVILLDVKNGVSDYKLSSYGKTLIKNLSKELLSRQEKDIFIKRKQEPFESPVLASLRIKEISKEFAKYGINVSELTDTKSKNPEDKKIAIKLLVKE